jgi:YVTN family beta-propeller protein
MRMLCITLCALAVLVAACGADSNPSRQPAQPTSNANLRTVRDIPLQGNTSRFDYESFDAQSHRLYIAHLGDGTATVYDTSSGAVVGEIKDVPGVHGVIAVPELGKVYATATDKNEVAVIDPNSLAVVATTDAGDYPDGLAYDPEVGKIYVSDEHGGTDTVIDTRTNQTIGKIQVGDDVGNTQFDPGSHRMLVVVGSRNQLVAIDPTSDKVAGTTDLPGCQGAHGLAIDTDARRAFVACEGNAKLLALDLQSMQVVFTGDVGKTPDVLDVDRSLQRVYVAAESGPLTIYEYSGGTVRQLLKADAGPNAHSVAVDPATHHIYLPLQNLNGHPALREMVVEL